tara:strand:+ start:1498 stop:2286 length:789 start_codon:yes stop_codon:yes gene_type:complete
MIKNKTFKYIYEGIFGIHKMRLLEKNSFYLDKFYENNQKKIISEVSKKIISKYPIPSFYKQHTQYLINIISSIRKKKINILDIGGGWGIGYANCIESFDKKKLANYKYHIFDLENICTIGKEYFKKKLKLNKNLMYISNLDKIKKTKYDIIFFGSSLQYFSKPYEVLEKILKIECNLLVFIDTYLTREKTFFTIQKYYNTSVPHSFLNKNQFLNFLNKKYKLVSSSYSHTIRLGDVGKINMNNFPKKYRVNNSLNLIFNKKI